MISRRTFVQAIGAAATRAEAQERTASLANQALRFQIVHRGGRIAGRKLVNHLANETVDLPESDFELEFEGTETVAAAACAAEIARVSRTKLELLYRKADVEVRVDYELPEGKAYLRKQISVRRTANAGRRLLRADLEDWRGVRRPWKSMKKVDRLPYGSHPIYCDTMWAGVEFVAWS